MAVIIASQTKKPRSRRRKGECDTLGAAWAVGATKASGSQQCQRTTQSVNVATGDNAVPLALESRVATMVGTRQCYIASRSGLSLTTAHSCRVYSTDWLGER
jgi:hypothetical protein